MKNLTRPAIFKWRQTAPELILCAVRWYLRYSLSLRDVEELLTERALVVDLFGNLQERRSGRFENRLEQGEGTANLRGGRRDPQRRQTQ